MQNIFNNFSIKQTWVDFWSVYITQKIVRVSDWRVKTTYNIVLIFVVLFGIWNLFVNNQYCEFVPLQSHHVDQSTWWSTGDWEDAMQDREVGYCNGTVNTDYWFSPNWQYIDNKCVWDVSSKDFTRPLADGLRASTSLGIFRNETQTHVLLVPHIEELNFYYKPKIKIRDVQVSTFYSCDIFVHFNVFGDFCFFSWQVLLYSLLSLTVLFGVVSMIVDELFSAWLRSFYRSKYSDDVVEWATQKRVQIQQERMSHFEFMEFCHNSECASLTVNEETPVTAELMPIDSVSPLVDEQIRNRVPKKVPSELYNHVNDQVEVGDANSMAGASSDLSMTGSKKRRLKGIGRGDVTVLRFFE